MLSPGADASSASATSRIWVTLITRSSYLPGVVLLVHTLYKNKSIHPIVVQYTSSLGQESIDCLCRLTSLYPLSRTQLVQPIALPKGLDPVATRFNDTLTKLRVFEPMDNATTLAEVGLERPPEQCCFLDADIVIFRNMDEIFDIQRPGAEWIAAHHACVCNIDNDPWAAPDWNVDNCASTPLVHPSALTVPTPSTSASGVRPTYRLLNSGVFVCTPSRELWQRIDNFRLNDARVANFTFPDQNFLDVFFRDYWVPVGWQYNALKTHRYWHSSAWRDNEVRALHYIVDKPWEKRNSEDGTAGYLGRDGVTHSWWWKEYDAWERWIGENQSQGILEIVREHVAPPSNLNG